ncbi:hypothetical protein CERZMDRAFT_80974 [Cercospora zeae-maydis SCOH1-5]|uniref:Uncharacterized protein n=1 Tax=Cercospora zeae-maydis SCOH1-5 TaxID=717836 RepID=A0A6A6FU66_9PEZI|nr:hypothetical protein CERZMDRAFT_80974 [Cercospora zeae-maydis SCOH1-5]
MYEKACPMLISCSRRTNVRNVACACHVMIAALYASELVDRSSHSPVLLRMHDRRLCPRPGFECAHCSCEPFRLSIVLGGRVLSGPRADPPPWSEVLLHASSFASHSLRQIACVEVPVLHYATVITIRRIPTRWHMLSSHCLDLFSQAQNTGVRTAVTEWNRSCCSSSSLPAMME